MKEVLYTKYNSLRKPKYQISTSIYLEDGKKYVEKRAITDSAVGHIEEIAKNTAVIQGLYTDIQILSGTLDKKKIVFPFLEGESLLSDLDVQMDSLEQIIEKLQKVLDKIHQYRPAYQKTFEMTEDFQKFFGEISLKEEPAVSIANLDGIFSNFLKDKDGTIWCMDCEWIVEFPVPIRFLRYRALQYFYIENYVYLKEKAAEKEFIQAFGFTEEDIVSFSRMEEAFQQKVYGKNHEFVYVDNYKKQSQTWDSVLEHKRHLEQVMAQQQAKIEEQQAQIQKMDHDMNDYRFLLRRLAKKVKRRLSDVRK